MIAADTNIYLHAFDSSSPFYKKALDFFQSHKENKRFCVSDLMLVELYMQLRNKAVLKHALPAKEAVDYCLALSGHPDWRLIEYQPHVMEAVWPLCRSEKFAFRKIIDARMAFSLIDAGVIEFATANIKDFQGFGFKRVWNPLEE